MTFNNAIDLFWYGQMIVQVLIFLRMKFSSLKKDYPWFFGYIVFHLAKTAVLFTIAKIVRDGAWYYSAWWMGELMDAIFCFFVMREIYGVVFRRYSGLPALGNVLFRWLAAVLILMSAVAGGAAAGTSTERLTASLLSLGLCITLIQVGFLLFLFGFTGFFKLGWQHYTLGIALCFALEGSIDLVVTSVRLSQGSYLADNIYRLAKTAGYTCSMVLCLTYLVTSPRTATSLPKGVPRQELEEWDVALVELLQR